MTKGCNATVGSIAWQSHGKVGQASANQYFSSTLIWGICGSLCQNYVRVFELATGKFTVKYNICTDNY